MTESDVAGTWDHENAVPMGGGVMRMTSCWSFDTAGLATLATEVVLEHGSQTAIQNATRHVGRWSILADTLVVELGDHTDSPFTLCLTERGELMSSRRGTWRRSVQP